MSTIGPVSYTHLDVYKRQQPGGGSTVYYTTDGSFPGSGNANAIQYTTPFTVTSGTIVRTAAYNGTLQGSMVDTFVVN